MNKQISSTILILLGFLLLQTTGGSKQQDMKTFHEKWIKTLPFRFDPFDSEFWTQPKEDWLYPSETVKWERVSGRGHREVYSPAKHHIPPVWGIIPNNIRLRFNPSDNLEIIRIHLWNKGDAHMYLSRDKNENPFDISEQFLSDCRKEQLEVSKHQKKISRGLREKVKEVVLGATLFTLQEEPREYLIITLTPYKPRKKLNPVEQKLKDSRRQDLTAEKMDFRSSLKSNVTRRSNGDVIISGIPMIDQGDKGYCVPATCARIMQYYQFDTDEHEIARLMGTTAFGGTSLRAFEANIRKLAQGLPIFPKHISFRSSRVKRCIDSGYPIIWMIPGHCRMIMGYNEAKETILYTDSWGRRGLEGSMSYDRAKALTQMLVYLK